MDDDSTLEGILLKNLMNCNICWKPLNVAPVVYNDKLGHICGRCSTASFTDMGAYLRQKTYEEFIEKLTFPCINKKYGCEELLSFNDVPGHEITCRYQCTYCPLTYQHLFFNKSCVWRGNMESVSDHLKTHKDTFCDPPQFEFANDKSNSIFFTSVANQVITVVIKYVKENKYVCLLMVNGTDIDSQCFKYQLELSDEDKSNSLALRRNRLEPLSGFLDYLQRPDKLLEVDMDKVSVMLQNPKQIFARFGIVKKPKKEIMKIAGLKDGQTLPIFNVTDRNEISELPDEEMLLELECPVCNEFMVPPIYICPTGHSICDNCIAKVQICPTCRHNFASGRNFTLEKLTTKVKYPCRNRHIGCGFVSTSEKIKKHQNNCELSESDCVMRCGWRGVFPSMYNHFLEMHDWLLKEHDSPIPIDNSNDSVIRFYFIYVMGEMFCLSLNNPSKFALKLNLQHLSRGNDQPKFKYTVSILQYKNTSCPSLSFNNFCKSWNGNLEDSLKKCITVPGDLFKQYVSLKELFYIRVCITKV